MAEWGPLRVYVCRLTAGHTGEAACVIQAVQRLAGVVRSVHALPTLHAGPCQQRKMQKKIKRKDD